MNDLWRQIAAWLIGEDLSAAAGGLETSIQSTWAIPPGVLVLALLGATAIVFFTYWHESPSASRPWKVLLTGLRSALVALVLLMLFGWTVQRHRTDLPDVVVILDDSASMALIDKYDESGQAMEIQRRLTALSLDGPTRLDLAKALLLDDKSDFVAELGRRYNLRCFLAGGSARAIGNQPLELPAAIKQVTAEQPASRLGNCLRDVLESQRGRPTAAIIVLTDGVTTDGKSLTDAAQYARRKSVPLFFVGLGSERPQRDLRLADLLADESAFAGDLLHFDAKLSAEGFTGPAVVRLHRAGEQETLAEQHITLDPSPEPKPVRLAHRAEQPGEFEYVIEIAPHEGEANVENNRLTRKVTVREETIRVLLVQAYPSYEFRFLKQMLLRELNANQPPEGKAAGFRTVLQEADLEYGETDKTAERAFPASRDELFQYDVLIFGDVNPSLLSPSIMNNIYEFVTVRGGGLIFMAGPRYTPVAYRDTPLAPLFPMNLDTVSIPDAQAIVAESFRPRLTPLGLSSPNMQLADAPGANEKLWREELAPLRWLASVPDLRPGVRVLAEHPTRRTDRGGALPVICLQFIGAGKVVFHATDETHRWRFRVGDVYFARYWVQTIRYLCRAKLLQGNRVAELATDREQYRRGEEVNLRVRFLDDRMAPAEDDGVMVVVERQGGERRSVALHRHALDRGVFEGAGGPLPDGKYRAWVAAPTLGGAPAASQFAVVAPPGELARTQMDSAELKEAAKISAGKFYTFATADKLLADLPRGRQVRIESMPAKPIWNAPILAGLFVGLIAVEWLLRKRLGML
jgi:hypothetical protein